MNDIIKQTFSLVETENFEDLTQKMASTNFYSLLGPFWLLCLLFVITSGNSLQKNLNDNEKYSTTTAIDAELVPITESKHLSALKMKNGFGFNQLKLNYGATLATNTNHNRNHNHNHNHNQHHHNHPASLNKNINPNLLNTINGNNNENNNNNKNQPEEFNPHLEVSLIDVEPEGNLFLDETYFQTAATVAATTTTTASTINKRLFTHSIKPNDNNGSINVNVNDNFNNARTKPNTGQPTGNKFVDIR